MREREGRRRERERGKVDSSTVSSLFNPRIKKNAFSIGKEELSRDIGLISDGEREKRKLFCGVTCVAVS